MILAVLRTKHRVTDRPTWCQWEKRNLFLRQTLIDSRLVFPSVESHSSPSCRFSSGHRVLCRLARRMFVPYHHGSFTVFSRRLSPRYHLFFLILCARQTSIWRHRRRDDIFVECDIRTLSFPFDSIEFWFWVLVCSHIMWIILVITYIFLFDQTSFYLRT